MSPYNDHAAFESLIDSMAEAYADRPADLKRLDKSREQDPRTRPANKTRIGTSAATCSA